MAPPSNSQCDTKILPPRLCVGQRLKHFQLETMIGEGGMGVVYRALDEQLCRPVAVKVLPPELTSDPERKQRFMQEARAAARISHPAIAQIYYVDEQEGTAFIVMELVDGKTVRDLIEAHELDLLGVIDIGIQAADGLAKAHELGIVHRDIKPANVMVTRDGHVKILDFGLAKLLPGDLKKSAGARPPTEQLAQSTLPGVVMGTAAYMSPEQVRGAAVDGRADIFSLGVLLYEMASGHSPFQRDSFVDSMHAVAYSEVAPLGNLQAPLPDELQRIVARCLRKEPDERYPNAQLLARDLRVLRRNTESGVALKTSWHLRMTDALDRLRQVSPAAYGRVGVILAAIGFVFYLSFARIGTAGIILLLGGGLYFYRLIRNRPQRMQAWFVRRMAKIPEVLVVAFQQGQFTVVVERPAAQLYRRINHHLASCNRKLFFGDPMTVSILHDLAAEKFQELLQGPGVQYVRHDVFRDQPQGRLR